MRQLILELSDELAGRLDGEARGLGLSPQERVTEILDRAVAPAENLAPGAVAEGLVRLRRFLEKVPAVTVLSVSKENAPRWWVKLKIDIASDLAWDVVQALGHVLNYWSLKERLPTVFMPVSPPPYLNGGPEEFLSWVIEATIPFADAGLVADVLEETLPSPVADPEQWRWDNEEDEDDEDDEEAEDDE